MSPTHIGNCSNIINWDDVINSIENKPGVALPRWDWDHPEFIKIKQLSIDSNYLKKSAEWINYYPNKDYDSNIDKLFGAFVGNSNYARAWISRINPGCTAPWHWDIDDFADEYENKGSLVRYTARINKDGTGQVAVVSNYAIVGGQQGDVYRWHSYKDWHGSANFGYTVKYQFNYLAYE